MPSLALDDAFRALADPTRRAILLRLVEGEATVNELAAPFDISQPAISRHLKVLETSGLITRRRDGTKRPCRLVSGSLDALDQYLDLLRRALDANYSRLDQLLARQAGTTDSRPTTEAIETTTHETDE